MSVILLGAPSGRVLRDASRRGIRPHDEGQPPPVRLTASLHVLCHRPLHKVVPAPSPRHLPSRPYHGALHRGGRPCLLVGSHECRLPFHQPPRHPTHSEPLRLPFPRRGGRKGHPPVLFLGGRHRVRGTGVTGLLPRKFRVLFFLGGTPPLQDTHTTESHICLPYRPTSTLPFRAPRAPL